MAFQRGLDEQQEQSTKSMVRDTRRLGQRISDFFKQQKNTCLFLFLLMTITFFASAFSEFFFLFGLIITLYCITRKLSLPFRMPMRSGAKDYNDLIPGTNKPNKASGIYYFGNDKKTQDELWFTDGDMRTHALIFGSTGSGKTEYLAAIAFNALIQASGFIYVDGKGDNGLFAKLFSMVRSMGREDDMLLINFMTGARDIIGPQKKRLSNTLNPFAMGSSSMLAQLIVSLMPGSSGSSDGDMWKGRAIGFVEAIMKVMVHMRDSGHILLDANTIRNYFLLPKLESIVIDKLFMREGQESINLEGLPESLLEPIKNYVYNLPGYNPEKKGKQVSQVLEQHGFITMQLTRIFTSLADTYSHILRTNLAEVDLSDVVLNRRILCVLLPALEKSPDELANLGKIIIATLKAMMAAGLGDSVEGEIRDIVESRPTNSKTPFLCILDEYGYYAVEGFAVVPAQARSLGFSVIFAGQDLPAFQKASKEEAASIGANTNIKVCMKLEDPTETLDFFMKTAGESYVTQVESYQVNMNSVIGNYQDNRGARLEKRARIDILDLKEQSPGDMHMFFKSRIVRGRTFYAAPNSVKAMRLNHLLKVAMPEDQDAKQLLESFSSFDRLISEGVIWDEADPVDSKLQLMFDLFTDKTEQCSPVDQAMKCLVKEVKPVKESELGADQSDIPDDFFNDFLEDYDDEAEADDNIDIISLFTPMRQDEYLESILLVPNDLIDEFKMPILDRVAARNKLEYIERLSGKTGQQSMGVAVELLADMERGTVYPQEEKPEINAHELTQTVDAIIKAVSLQQEKTDD
jgi:intracellular multiplication protein IcmO